MESAIGLYKTELIKKQGPWKTLADVELATAEYVDWFNTRRLHTAIGAAGQADRASLRLSALSWAALMSGATCRPRRPILVAGLRKRLTRDSLAAQLPQNGHAVRNAKVSRPLTALRHGIHTGRDNARRPPGSAGNWRPYWPTNIVSDR